MLTDGNGMPLLVSVDEENRHDKQLVKGTFMP
jgi:hypothetical protein